MSAPEIPDRLLLGPGPSNAHPRVLEAMARPLLGHMDPAFLEIVEEVKARLRRLFGTENEMTLPLSATGSAGMEACFVNLLEPGDHAVIGVAGVFGERMCEVAHRAGANVHRVETEWGTTLSEAAMLEAIEQHGPRVVAFVHAETSTGVCQPVEAIAAAARAAGAYVVLDCVTSLGGLPLAIDAWGVDAVYSGTQKCLSCPPGLSPASFSPRAIEHVAERHSPVQSWYLDISLLAGYYGKTRVYHHTAPISAIYALAEGLRIVEEEGMPAREKRHREASAHLLEGLSHLGFEPLVEAGSRLPQLNTVRLPERVLEEGEATLRKRLLDSYGIEVGGGLGPLAGKIWRIGLMGENARSECVDRLLHALQDELD
ncbi:MAG: aminotransferase class V-fold PLP-dependent enzyme [Deltaproteobacteria bacterium]|nr:aminotransferase class V-fold PLP-dependent enzyme [Deltaproteobacteria bacterium]MBW2446485.1 aminotransferase class V-fold PLP-dependent enzyme [Deltaproteobacteria bacterium]